MAEVASLTIQLDDAFSAGADAATSAAEKLAAGMDKVTASSQTQDTVIRTRGQTFDSIEKKYDGNAAALARLETIESRYQAQVKITTATLTAQGASAADIADKIARLGNVRDAEAVRAVKYGQQVEAVATGTKSMGDAADKASGHMKGLGEGTSGATRELIVLGHEAISGNWNRLPGSLMVLAERGNGVKEVFSGLASYATSLGGAFTLAAAAGTAAFVGLGYLAEHENNRIATLRQELRGTHEDYDTLSKSVDSAAKQVAATTTASITDARIAAQTIASAFDWAGTTGDLVAVTKVSLDLARVWKVDVATSAAFLKTALDDPGKAAKELADRHFPGMTSALATSVAQMQAAGHASDAFNTVLGVLQKGTKGATDDLTPLGTALKNLKDHLFNAKDGGKSLATQMGELADSFLTVQVRGLDKLIEGLEKFVAKAEKAGPAIKSALSNVPFAFNENGTAINVTPGGGALSNTPVNGYSTNATLTSSATKEAFVSQWLEAAKTAGSALGVSPEVLLAQWGLETRTGQSLYNYNAGNIKANDYYIGDAHTGADGSRYRSYSSPDAFAKDFVSVLQEPRYAAALNTGSNVSAYANAVKNAGYATDPNYVTKVVAYASGIVPTVAAASPITNATASPITSATSSPVTLATGSPVTVATSSPVAIATASPATTAAAASSPISIATLTPVAAATSSPVTIATPSAATTAAASSSPLLGGTSATAIAATIVTPSMIDDAKKNNAELDKRLQTTREIVNAGLDLEIKNLNVLMEQEAATTGKDTAAYREHKELLETLQATRYKNVEAIVAAQRASESSLASTRGQTAADQALSAALESRRQVSLQSRGTELSAAEAAQVHTNVLKAQEQQLGRTEGELVRTTANSTLMAAAYDKGNQAVIDATAEQSAYTKALELFGTNIPTGKLDELTAFYKNQAKAAGEAKVAQTNLQSRDSIAYIQEETSTLGMNEDQRTKLLAVMKAEQAMHAQFGDILPKEAQDYVTLAGNIADATSAYQHQQAVSSELSSFFTSTFDTIGNAITSAFATGEISALKFKDIAKSVASAVLSEFVKLAVINPLKSFLFGSTNSSVTLSDVLGFLGGGSTSSIGASSGGSGAGAISSLLGMTGAFDGAGNTLNANGTTTGSSSSSSSSSSSLSTLGSIGGLLSKVGGIKELGQLLGGNYTGSGLGIVGQVGSLNIYSTGSTVGQTVSTAAADDFATAGGSATSAGTSAGVSVTVGQALGVIGGLYSAYSGFQRGGVGGTIGGVAGLAGAGLAAASTGALGAGAAGLAAAAGPYAPIALAAIAVISAFLPGAHPLHSYQGTEVTVQDGHVVSGKTVSQVQSSDEAVKSVNEFGTALDSYMGKVGLVLTNLTGTIGAVGQGIEGYTQYASVTDPAIFSKLQFAGNPADTSNFGVAKGALTDMRFNSIEDLSTELVKIAGFADAVTAVGIQLKSVGKDISAIQISGVTGGNANALGSVTDASGNIIRYHNDLRTALNADLPGQTFADTSALDTEINKVNTFVNQTLPQLLTPIEKTSSSITDAVANIDKTYSDAIQQSLQYGLDNTTILQKAEADAIAIVRRTALMSLTQDFTSIVNRFLVATNDNVYTQQQSTLDAFWASQQNEIETFTKSWTDIFGDGVKSTVQFQGAMQGLMNTLGAEWTTKVNTTNKAIQAQYISLWQSFQSNYMVRDLQSQGDNKSADLLTYDIKAEQERQAYIDSQIAFWGEQITGNEGFQSQLAVIDKVHAEERLAIEKKYATDSTTTLTNTLSQAQGNVVSLFGSLKSYANSLQTGSDSPLSPIAQYDLASRQFDAVSGAAKAGDYSSASQLQGYSQSLVSAARAVYGSGQGYADTVNRVLDAISGTASNADMLTLSAQQKIVQDQTAAIVDSQTQVLNAVQDLKAEVTALRREQMATTRAAALQAA